MICVFYFRAGSEFLGQFTISVQKSHFLLTVGAVGGLLDWRFLDLHLHLQACGSLPAPRASVLPDDLGDADHIWGNFEERSEVLDQVVSEELVLGHGGQLEGDEENWGGSDLCRCGASQHHLQHLVVLVEVVGAHSGVQLGDVLTWRDEMKKSRKYDEFYPYCYDGLVAFNVGN